MRKIAVIEKIKRGLNRPSTIVLITMIGVVIGTILLITNRKGSTEEVIEVVDSVVTELFYDIPIDSCMDISTNSVENGASLATLLGHHGITAKQIDDMQRVSGNVFSFRSIRAGNSYTTISAIDTTSGAIPPLRYFIYDIDNRQSVIFEFTDSLIQVRKFEKEVVVKRKRMEGVINSSLWNTILDNGGDLNLAAQLSDVYQWTIDFYGIQKGDNFTVIYDQEEVDGIPIGIGKIWGAVFEHKGKAYYAVRFEKDNLKGYWDETGASLKKSFLKAPLKFSRISSKFSNSRMHPVLRIRRPHYGVDYAAPTGTPVQAVANGTVIYCGRKGGEGNMIKIKHGVQNGLYTTGYLHLSRFAKGMRSGKQVEQGEVIGYVGSTGLSSGPHLDFRIWRSGTPIDPLKMTQEKGEPIPAAFKEEYNRIQIAMIDELNR